MMEDDFDALLAAKVKGCVSGKMIPDSMRDRLVRSVRRSRCVRIRIAAVIAVVIASALLTVGLMGRTASHGDGEVSIIATQGHRGEDKVSGWMLLSVFRDLFRRNRTNKRKEEE